MSRILFLIALLIAGPALGQSWPSSKPPPLGAPEAGSQMPTPMPTPMMPAPGQVPQAGTAQRCAAPLAAGCQRMQSSCQVACPTQWSTNPNAPAFTTNDRAGCMQRCFHQYLACQRQYGC